MFLGLIMCSLFVATNNNALAYGGGGFPPGYFENPRSRFKFECNWINLELPNGHLVSIPKCGVGNVIHNSDQGVKQESNLKYRFESFIERVRNGGR